MAGLCRTEAGDRWRSEIIRNGRREVEGSFTIDSETPRGAFDGTFTDDRGNQESISGQCTGTTMSFDRARSHYEGTFAHDNVVRGRKTGQAPTELADPRQSESNPPETEEWEGTKLPSLRDTETKDNQ